MGLINTRNAILTPDCKSLLTCYICLCVPTITGSCQPKPSGSVSPMAPCPQRQMCPEWWPPVQCTIHTAEPASTTPDTWASLLPCLQPEPGNAEDTKQTTCNIAGVRSEAKRGQNFHHKKKLPHCYENVRFITRNVISRSLSQFFCSCVVCCWFRGSFMPFFTQKVLVFSSPINMIAIPSQLCGEFNGTLEIVSQEFF